MWVKVCADAGFLAPGFETPGSYFKLEDISYLRLYGPSHLTDLYYVVGKSLVSNVEIALEPGYPTEAVAQAALDELAVSSEGVVNSDGAGSGSGSGSGSG